MLCNRAVRFHRDRFVEHVKHGLGAFGGVGRRHVVPKVGQQGEQRLQDRRSARCGFGAGGANARIGAKVDGGVSLRAGLCLALGVGLRARINGSDRRHSPAYRRCKANRGLRHWREQISHGRRSVRMRLLPFAHLRRSHGFRVGVRQT